MAVLFKTFNTKIHKIISKVASAICISVIIRLDFSLQSCTKSTSDATAVVMVPPVGGFESLNFECLNRESVAEYCQHKKYVISFFL